MIGEASGRSLGALRELSRASGGHLGGIWEAWAPKASPRWSERAGTQKSVTPLSYNPLFNEKVLKSIEFLRVPSISYAYLQQLSGVTWLSGSGPSPPPLANPSEPLQINLFGELELNIT